MNAKYFSQLTAIFLATRLIPIVGYAQAFQLIQNPMFKDVYVQRSPLIPAKGINSDSPPPVDGTPGDRPQQEPVMHYHQSNHLHLELTIKTAQQVCQR